MFYIRIFAYAMINKIQFPNLNHIKNNNFYLIHSSESRFRLDISANFIFSTEFSPLLKLKTSVLLANAWVSSRLDYCNSLFM